MMHFVIFLILLMRINSSCKHYFAKTGVLIMAISNHLATSEVVMLELEVLMTVIVIGAWEV